MKRDIITESDVRRVVETFVRRLRDDASIARYFQYVDWDTFRPQMSTYWSALLLPADEPASDAGHRPMVGRPFPKHMLMLGLDERHFQRWSALFAAAVDDFYTGRRAERMKLAVRHLTLTLQSRLHLVSLDD